MFSLKVQLTIWHALTVMVLSFIAAGVMTMPGSAGSPNGELG